MVGKGWIYVGIDWVQEHVWLDASTPALQTAIKAAVQGVIGLRGFRGITDTWNVRWWGREQGGGAGKREVVACAI